jgi:ubiquinone/menaquinone biosynthesis C-methylase UbiE
MAGNAGDGSNAPYALTTGQADRARLDLLHEVYGAVCEAALEVAGLPPGGHGVDIGCGSGNATRFLARALGPQGQVQGLDISPEQIAVAQDHPAEQGAAPISYQVGDAYDPPLARSEADILFCRFVLCHLRQPEAALASMVGLLKPGGRIVLVDLDCTSAFTVPPTGLCEEMAATILRSGAARGVDYRIGQRLPTLFDGLPVQDIRTSLFQPIYQSGPGKRFLEETRRSAADASLASGVIGAAALEDQIVRLSRFADRPDTWIAQYRVTIVTATRTG